MKRFELQADFDNSAILHMTEAMQDITEFCIIAEDKLRISCGPKKRRACFGGEAPMQSAAAKAYRAAFVRPKAGAGARIAGPGNRATPANNYPGGMGFGTRRAGISN